MDSQFHTTGSLIWVWANDELGWEKGTVQKVAQDGHAKPEEVQVEVQLTVPEQSQPDIDLTLPDAETELLFSTDAHDTATELPAHVEADGSLSSVWSQESADNDWTLSECGLLQHPDGDDVHSVPEVRELTATNAEIGNDTSFSINEDIDTPVLVPFCIGDADDEDDDQLATPEIDHSEKVLGPLGPMEVTVPDVPTINIVSEDDEDREYAAKSIFDECDDDEPVQCKFSFFSCSASGSHYHSYLLCPRCSSLPSRLISALFYYPPAV